jgi:hypothetical protein
MTCDLCKRAVIQTWARGDDLRVCLGCIIRFVREAERVLFLDHWENVTGRRVPRGQW